MGLIHQTNAGFVGDRGITQVPSANPNITPSFYLPGDSYTDTIAGLTGTTNGNVSIATDNPFGHASARSFHFTGGNIQFAGDGSHAYATSNMTISWWMKWAGFGQNGYQTIFSRRNSTGATTYEIGLDTGSNIHDDKMFYYYDSNSVHQPWRTQPPKDSWVHMCFKVTTSNGQGRIFMNGVMVSSHTSQINNATATYPLNVGGLGSNNQDYRGYICDFAIFRGFPDIFGGGRDNTFKPPSEPVAGENVIPPGVQQIQTI